MGIGYQATDRKVIDYDLWFHGGGPLAFRGPRGNLEAKEAICCIGAAQTFGRFVARPFAQQLAQILARPVINLGFSGAGPEFYLGNAMLMTHLERAAIVVAQGMSARSVSAGLFQAQSNNGVLEFLDGPLKGETLLAQQAYGKLREIYGEQAYRDQVAAAQAQWLRLYEQLAGRLTGRKIFLWMSSAAPGDNVDLSKSPVGTFPHFVDRAMVDQIATMGYEVVTCTLPDMPGQILVNDRTGLVEEVFDAAHFPTRPDRLRAINTYYATPQMHDLAARQLITHILSGA